MPRPREFDTEATLARIRDAFWRGGYAGTTMQDIVEATGVRAGSLHAAFGGKDALFALAFESYGRHFVACMQTGARGAEAIRRYVVGLCEAVIADTERKGCLIVQAALDAERLAPETRDQVEARLADVRRFFVDRLAEDGRSDPDLVASLFGVTVAVLALGRTQTPPEVLRGMVRAALQPLD